jgi:IPT/TIG domain
MARKLDGSYITANTITTTQLTTTVVNQISAGGGPKVTTITYPNSATAAVNTGNESIVLTGTGFESGVQVYINGSAAPAVSRTNSTSLSFTTPALTTGTTYPLYVVNPDGGTAVVVPGMVVSAGPVWVTGSALNAWNKDSALSTTLQATSDSTVSYALDVGSSLPSGITLAANGLLSGTLTSPPGAQTTYNFTVTATDLELQKSSKAFSINATLGITATGGTVSNIAGYRIHTFTSSGSFQVTNGSTSVEYLVVGGGASGGQWVGGGGGAGGFRTGTLSVSPGTYAITVGAGGSATGSTCSGNAGNDGSASSFGPSVSSAGGGGGGSYSGVAGRSGGSGGGSAQQPLTPAGAGNVPSVSPSQGNSGGAGISSPSWNSGGGGGAGTAGDIPSVGRGGGGAASSITGASVTYAGGGGAYGGGAGGAGGGGQGTVDASNTGSSGTVNTGGGGGGGGGCSGGNLQGGGGKAGGSGIVIIRYAA